MLSIPLFFISLILFSKSLNSDSLSSIIKLSVLNDSTPIDILLTPPCTKSSNRSSSISFGLHSNVYSHSGDLLNISKILNYFTLYFLVKHEGVTPPI